MFNFDDFENYTDLTIFLSKIMLNNLDPTLMKDRDELKADIDQLYENACKDICIRFNPKYKDSNRGSGYMCLGPQCPVWKLYIYAINNINDIMDNWKQSSGDL